MITTAPETTRLARLARRLGLDRNPLRRRTDRAETGVMAALLAAMLIGTPLAAVTAAHVEDAAAQRAVRAQQTWHQVPAVVLQGAPADNSFAYETSVTEWVKARWTAPGGEQRVGVVPVPAGKRAGSTAPVWVNGSGRAMGMPLTAAQIRSQVIAAAIFVPLMLSILLISAAALAHWLIERRRMARWEAAWSSVEPYWTNRR